MRLQKAPLGLLGLLELKTQGENPNEFSDTVSPVIEASDFYAAPALTIVEATGNVTNKGDILEIVVPNNTAYRLRTLSMGVALAAGEGCCVALGYRIDPNGVLAQFHQDTIADGDLAGVCDFPCCMYFDRPFLVGPGGRIGGIIRSNLSGASAAALRAVVEILTA
ncbi:MAG TPA: hypothetical protein VFN76_07475 [Candidatus Limnocylindria bacterium]|nr:hypothetical protein [Candidatus Limnocylindria bacterium]